MTTKVNLFKQYKDVPQAEIESRLLNYFTRGYRWNYDTPSNTWIVTPDYQKLSRRDLVTPENKYKSTLTSQVAECLDLLALSLQDSFFPEVPTPGSSERFHPWFNQDGMRI